MVRRAIDFFAVSAIAAVVAVPASAGTPPVPGPVAGIGIGAVVLLGFGYRALRNRVGK